jgi:hypothetical protein
MPSPRRRSSAVLAFLESGYLLLETDSQHCCRWVTPWNSHEDDPPVYLIDPDDRSCQSRSRYAATFSTYVFAQAWDALLWGSEVIATDFDHPLPPQALPALASRFRQLPTTYGWAINQGCDAVYRFDGDARVALAVQADTALWSVAAAPSPALAATIASVLGASFGL